MCSIAEDNGLPEFVISVKELKHENVTYRDTTPKRVWDNVLTVVERQRRTAGMVKIFPEYLSGEYLFGLTEPSIIRIIESVRLLT